jgi:hypothetical protein
MNATPTEVAEILRAEGLRVTAGRGDWLEVRSPDRAGLQVRLIEDDTEIRVIAMTENELTMAEADFKWAVPVEAIATLVEALLCGAGPARTAKSGDAE